MKEHRVDHTRTDFDKERDIDGLKTLDTYILFYFSVGIFLASSRERERKHNNEGEEEEEENKTKRDPIQSFICSRSYVDFLAHPITNRHRRWLY